MSNRSIETGNDAKPSDSSFEPRILDASSEKIGLLQEYQHKLERTVCELPVEKVQAAVDILHAKRMSGNRIFIMGNGGSSSAASHFVCDLNKNVRAKGLPDFKAFSLTDNMPVFSAYANDEGYENVFSRQLENDLAPGDVVIGISASGNSENVLRGIRYACDIGAYTIAFTGFDGGKLSPMVDLSVHVANNLIEQVEDTHLVLEHMIVLALKQLNGLEQTQARDDSLQVSGQKAVLEESIVLSESEGIPVQGGSSMGEWIYHFNRSILDRNGDDEFLEQVLESAFNLLGADSGSLLRYDVQGNPIGGLTVYAGKMVRRNAEEVSVIGQKGMAKWVFDHQLPVLIEDTREDTRWIAGEGDKISRSAVSIPLVIEGETIGVLSLARLREKGYTDGHLAFLMTLNYLFTHKVELDNEEQLHDFHREDLPKVE